ncbi:MAG TPA: hypothetical protein VFA26_17900 [Gemmataceae bacterium]|nr:hypothetical protein [Gemmataceae bacterium]
MLTSYWVRCPHLGCNWSGNLLPQGDTRLFTAAVPGTKVVVFQCPTCQGQWKGQVVGDDVRPLPLEQTAVPRR